MTTVGVGEVPIVPDFTGFQAKANQGVESGLSKLGGIAQKALLGVGVLAGAAFTKGLSDNMNAGAAQDKLAAQLGLPEKEAKRLGGIAGKVYAQAYGDSLSTVNEALKNIRQQGLVVEDASSGMIERITKKTLDLSTAFDQDLSQATAAVGTLMKTGLAADADEAFDVITRGFQQGVDKQGDFLDTLTEYPTLFRDLGLSAKSATGILSQGLQAGARDSDKVADALKEFSIRAVDGSKLTGEGFQRLGLDAEDMAQKIAGGGQGAADALDLTLDKLRGIKDPVERAQVAVALFGTQAEDLGDALYALDPSEAVDALGKVEGAADRMGKTLNDNGKARFEAFKRQALMQLQEFAGGAVDAVSGLWDRLEPKLAPIFDWATNAREALGFLWENFDQGTLSAEAFGEIMTLVFGSEAQGFLEGLGRAAGTAVDGLQKLAGWGQKAFGWAFEFARENPGPAFTLFGTVILTFLIPALIGLATAAWGAAAPIIAIYAPVLAGALIIGALAGAVVYAYQHFEVFRTIVDTVADVLQKALGVAVRFIVDLWNNYLLPGIQAVASFFVDVLWPAVQTAWDGITKVVVWAWQNVIHPIFEILRFTLMEVLIPAFQAIMWVITTIVMPLVTAAIKEAWEIIRAIFDVWVWWLDITLGNAFRALQWLAGIVWDGIRAAVSAAWGKVEPIFEAVRSFMADKLTPVWEGMRAAAAAAWDALPGIINGALRIIGGLIGGFLSGVGGIADAIGLDHIADVLKGGAATARSWGQGPAAPANVGGIAVVGGIRRHSGGGVPGPNVDADIVPAMLTPGEFIIRKQSVQKFGPSFFEALNAGRLPGFAKGGLIPNPLDTIRGLADGVVDTAKALGTRALETVWPKLDASGDLFSLAGKGGAMVAGGANYLRDSVLKLIRDKEAEAGNLSGGGFTRQGGGGPPGQYTQGMLRAKSMIQSLFGNFAFGGYSNRNIAGTGTKSQHALWRAWDIMVGLGNVATGNRIANWLIQNAGQFGLKGLIWNNQKNFGKGWGPYGHPGGGRNPTLQHEDHIHAEFYNDGGLVHGRSFDSGGILAPGWNKVRNDTGAPEHLVPAGRSAPLIGEAHFNDRESVDELFRRAEFEMNRRDF